MTTMISRARSLVLVSLASAFASTAAQAAITINVTQVGSSVVASGSGSFNTAGLTLRGSLSGSTGVNAGSGLLRVGSPATYSNYSGVSGPNLGPTNAFITGAGSGDQFGVGGFANQIYLPLNYVSGSALSGSATFANSTIASLGLSSGTYTFQSAVDTVTINIGAGGLPPLLPEPASWALMILGFGAVGMMFRRRVATMPLQPL